MRRRLLWRFVRFVDTLVYPDWLEHFITVAESIPQSEWKVESTRVSYFAKVGDVTFHMPSYITAPGRFGFARTLTVSVGDSGPEISCWSLRVNWMYHALRSCPAMSKYRPLIEASTRLRDQEWQATINTLPRTVKDETDKTD